MAKAYLRQAEARIRTAERALKEGNYPYSVRQAQEAVELSLKAVLRLVGIEPPKWHDVGPILRKNRNRFPNWFRELIDELAFISRQLRREREVSMYGDEEMGIPPNHIYNKFDAEKYLEAAKKVCESCQKLFNEVVNRTLEENIGSSS